MRENNGWSEYQRLVLSELRRLSDMQETQTRHAHALESQLAVLHVKVGLLAGLFGLLGGAIPVTAAMILRVI